MHLYDTDPYCTTHPAKVTTCTPLPDNLYAIELDQTIFYPEGGGQPYDTGTLDQTPVLEVRKTKEGSIHHHCPSPFPIGQEVTQTLDWNRRFDHMQQHSGEHIVSGLAHSFFGCDNVGFHMGKDMITIDFNKALTPDQVTELEEKANQYIWENHPIEVTYPSDAERKTLHYRSKIELTGEVRIVTFPGADSCACCGTHVATSGGVGLVKLFTCHPRKEGVRIELLCGRRALAHLSLLRQENTKISNLLSAKPTETSQAVERLHLEKEDLTSKLKKMEGFRIETIAKSYCEQKNLLLFLPDFTTNSLRILTESLPYTDKCFCFTPKDPEGFHYVLASKTEDLRPLAKQLAATFQGKGGGKQTLVQGSVIATQDQLETFLEAHMIKSP